MGTKQVSAITQDQRLLVRKALHSHGTLVLQGRVVPFDAIDIGLGGTCIAVSRQLKQEQCCRIDLPLFVNGRRLDVVAVARVTYCVCGRNGFKAGMQFIEMINKTSAAAIVQFMR